MLSHNEDKKLLIETMKKLIHYVANNIPKQKQIFNSLSKNEMLKIIDNLSNDNQYLRRVSGLLLCQLLYNNSFIKQSFVAMLQLYPVNGRICLNKIPDQIQRYPSTMKKCLELIKLPIKAQQTDKLCWVINLDKKSLQIQFFEYKKYSSFTFLDPARNLFGFTMMDQQKRIQQLSNQRNQRIISKQKVVNDKPLTQTYLQMHYRSKQSVNSSKQKISGSYRKSFEGMQLAKTQRGVKLYRPNIFTEISKQKNQKKIKQNESQRKKILTNRSYDFETLQSKRQSFRQKIPSEMLNSYTQSVSYKQQQDLKKKNGTSHIKSLINQSDHHISQNQKPIARNHDQFHKRIKQILRR